MGVHGIASGSWENVENIDSQVDSRDNSRSVVVLLGDDLLVVVVVLPLVVRMLLLVGVVMLRMLRRRMLLRLVVLWLKLSVTSLLDKSCTYLLVSMLHLRVLRRSLLRMLLLQVGADGHLLRLLLLMRRRMQLWLLGMRCQPRLMRSVGLQYERTSALWAGAVDDVLRCARCVALQSDMVSETQRKFPPLPFPVQDVALRRSESAEWPDDGVSRPVRPALRSRPPRGVRSLCASQSSA